MKSSIFHSSIQTTFFTSLFPLALGTLLSIISGEISFSPNTNDIQSLSWIEELFTHFKTPVFERIWSLYNNYWKFMLMMMIANLIIFGLEKLIKSKESHLMKKQLVKLSKKSDESISCDDSSENSFFLSIGKFIICSTLIFCFYQALDLLITSTDILPRYEYQIQYPRILQEDALIDQSELLQEPIILIEKPIPKSLSLSLGKMISSLNIDAYSIVISPDSKTAYTTLLRTGTLKIIDISDLDFPTIISSVSIHTLKVDYPDKALYLSPDGRTLFASTFQVLEIIDVTFPQQPKILSELIHPDLPEGLPGLIPQAYKITFALSSNSKTLYVAAFGLEIFDISNLTKPILISTDINGKKVGEKELVIMSSIAISSHYLFLAKNSLNIYDISIPHNPLLISNVKTHVPVNSISLSQDNSTIFALGTDQDNKVVFERLNIVDIKNSKSSQVDVLEISSYDSPYIVAVSPNSENILIHTNERKIVETSTIPLITFNNDLRVFNPHKRLLIDNTKSLVSHVYSAFFLPGEDKLILTSNDQFTILQLYLDYPNKRAFSLSTNSLAYFPTEKTCNSLALSSDGKTLFLAVGDPKTDSSLIMLDVSNNSKPIQIGSYDAHEFNRDSQAPALLRVSASESQRVYLVFNREILILNTDVSSSSSSSPTLIGSLTKEDLLPTECSADFKKYIGDRWKDTYEITAFEVSQDDSKAYILQNYDLNNCVIKIMDIHNLKSMTKMSEFMLPRRSFDHRMALTKDGQTLFLVQKMMLIYDVSNPESPKLANSTIVTPEDGDPIILAVTLSSDNKYLFVKASIENFLYMKIYDLKEKTAPELISEFPLPKYTTYLPKNLMLENFIALTPNNHLAYVDTIDKDISNYMLVVNTTNLASPVIQKVLPALNNSLMNAFKLSHDGKIGYAATKTGLQIFNFEPKYTLFLQSESFLLGQRSLVNALILKLNSSGEYVIMDEQYKFTKFSIFNMQIKPNENSPKLTYLTPPYWMSFDKENQILTIDPKSHNDLGTFTLYSAFSRKISLEPFQNIESLKDIKRLIFTLISLGYLDNQYFLTSRFGSKEDFFLPDDYSKHEVEKIYTILEQYYTETFTTFDIVSSIEADFFGGAISIHTMDPNAVKVDIKLENKNNQTQCQFVNKAYGLLQPVIIDRKSHLMIEGSLKEINRALREIVINLEDKKKPCPGEFIVTDYMNPPFSAYKNDFAKFFKTNGYPRETSNPNLTVQYQIDKAKIFTGQYFTININEKTFKDANIDILNYNIVMDDEDRSDIPTWLSFSDLALKGTPPEVIFGRDIGLIIIAKNEFKQVEVKFNLHISISPIFVMKLIIRYSPYILTMIGLWVSANKIYNVIGKKWYKHPKEFEIEYGKEIDIFPVTFIGEARSDFKEIMKHLGRIDGEGKEFIEEKIEEIGKKDKEILKGYRAGSQKRRDLVVRLIMNELILRQVEDSKGNMQKVFNQVKDKWPEFIYYDGKIFKVDETRLLVYLQNPAKVTDYSDDYESSLLRRSDLNMELLKNALEAYAFRHQSVDMKARNSRVVLKEKAEKDWIKRFLKMDLCEIKPGGNTRIDYGIKFEIKNNQLRFYGVPEEDVQGKTFVVQITTAKHKILKEIYIHGRSCFETMKSESYERGYEVF